ncbi:ABC transporter ATP-binding protein [Petroclostridium sp. X23]|uniref:ABC transporter ATP-binding protein n=1 Tax=Petroclostridium sp. X23 TaxID=3045146 RepID=UPI0024AE834E|nr:ABC transporter ATP-binding protein [Petroclostridium sp. X23]WHH61249.1 ABC transporter ATP-binding protein [Petroclostridium sp. X23]
MLKIENLSFSYGKIQAIKNVSFELKKGEIMAIVGANGAGKSSLMKCIAGLLKPQNGTIYCGDTLLEPIPFKVVENKVVLVPEGRWIFPNLTVEENLMMGGYTVNDRSPGIQHAYRMFPRLEERKQQRAGTMSGGEQQMLAIARGLMANPKVLLLDEPSLGLAPLIVNDIMSIIQEINREGISVLLVEQNARKALGIAHHGCVLEQGVIVKTGTGAELAQDESIIAAYLGGTKKKEQ